MVPNASITVRNEKTGQTRTVTTNQEGVYVATPLGPSTYTVTAEAAGMAPAEYTAVNLQVGQERTVNIVLQPAAVSTQVTVSGGDLVVVDTSSARVGSNVSEREVSNLPLNGRQVSQLYLLAPGAVNNGSGTFDNIRFSGRRTRRT